MAWMDVVILVIVVIHTIKGWINGFILSFFSTISFIVAAVTAKIYSPMLSKYILGNSMMLSKIQGLVGTRFEGAIHEKTLGPMGDSPGNLFHLLKFPKGIEELFMKSETLGNYSTKVMDGIQGYMVDILTQMFVDFLSVLLIFFCVKILLSWIAHLLNGVAKLPILKQFNSVGGIGFGLIKGLLIVFIFLFMITPFTTMTDQGMLLEGLEKSILGQYLYDHNPILLMIQGTFIG